MCVYRMSFDKPFFLFFQIFSKRHALHTELSINQTNKHMKTLDITLRVFIYLWGMIRVMMTTSLKILIYILVQNYRSHHTFLNF